jgi:hypothetical protein
MLLRFAKIAGGLRLLITESGPIVATSVGLLSARSVAYIVGFGLGSIVSSWLPIIALLISVTGFFGAGANTAECEAYRAQMRAIDDANRAALAAYQPVYNSWYKNIYQPWYEAKNAYEIPKQTAAGQACITGSGWCVIDTIGFLCAYCLRAAREITYPVPAPEPPTPPVMQTYPACSSPNCPPGKKVWTQVIWGSPGGNFTDAKGCFIVAYSQDAPTLAPKVEYNPFLPKTFVESRAISYYLVNGDRYRALQDSEWKNLETVQGWDKGYWRSEVVDPECRGWRPGWSKIVK